MSLLLFFFNDSTTTEISTLSLHDALPIYALGVAADLGNLRGAGTDQGATVGNQQHLVAVGDLHRAHQVAVALAGLDRDHALGTAALAGVIGDRGALAVAVLGGGEDVAVAVGLDHDHAAHPLAFGQ